MANYIIVVLCLVFVYTQISSAKPCGCGCAKPSCACAEPLVAHPPPPALDLGYAPPCLPKPEPYVYTGPPLPVIVKEPYPFVPPVLPVPAPKPIPKPCAGPPAHPAPCCEGTKHDKLALLKLAHQYGKLHCDCKKHALKQLLCKHLLKAYNHLCGCV